MRKEKREKKNKAIIEFLRKLPSERKVYYNTGKVMVEVSKEEAIRLLEKEESGED